MLATTPPSTTGKSLFSQHYLDTRLPAQMEWQEDPQPAFDAAQALWRRAQQIGATWNEAQTEDEFVKPLLAALGWSYIPQVKNRRSGRDTWKTDNNPSHQMVSYLVGTRCPWGILINGQVWRLYSREVSSTASEYYEIDLAGVFGEGGAESGERLEAFKRFWLFFRRAAFTPDS